MDDWLHWVVGMRLVQDVGLMPIQAKGVTSRGGIPHVTNVTKNTGI